MSLRAVHVIFVVAAVVLSFGLAAASLLAYREQGGSWALALGVGWFGLGVGLVVYGRQVIRKLRQLAVTR